MSKKNSEKVFWNLTLTGLFTFILFSNGCSPLTPSVSKLSNAGIPQGSSNNSTNVPDGNYTVENDLIAALNELTGASYNSSGSDTLVLSKRTYLDKIQPVLLESQNSWFQLTSSDLKHLIENGSLVISSKKYGLLAGLDLLKTKFTAFIIIEEKGGESKKSFKSVLSELTAEARLMMKPCLLKNMDSSMSSCDSEYTLGFTTTSALKSGKNDPSSGEIQRVLDLLENRVDSIILQKYND